MKVIVFENDNGGVSVMTPILDSGLTIEEIGGKDIPLLNGEPAPYLILDDSELPDRIDRDRWKIQGNSVIIDESIPLPETIREIDARRLRLALHQLNLLDTVETAIATLGRTAQIEWEYATIIKENYPLVISLSTELGLNVSEIFDIAIAK
jgi:hypothetical protein